MAQSDPKTGVFRVAALSSSHPTQFTLRPDAAARKDYAEQIDISAIRKLSFEGEIAPMGKRSWRMSAKLGATVVQPCVVTLEPVTTRIDETVERHYVPEHQIGDPEPGTESEMPEDDSLEPLGEQIDVTQAMIEALALALPLYPRAPGAQLGEAVFTEDGAEPIRDADLKPFAGLAGLKNKLEDKD